MYQNFYGLRELPFELTPDPRFLFLTHHHREAQACLRHGLVTAKGLVVLTGEAGTGKTTLLRTVLDESPRDRIRFVYLNNPTLTRDEFIEFLARGFGLSETAGRSKTSLLWELQEKLAADCERGSVGALVVDEAQSLPHELLEEVRLLANIETHSQKLLPVVLAGQPELADRLNEESLRQLKQRVALRCALAPLTLQETASYIAARIRTAGGDAARIFTREAVSVIYERSGGIPRTISVICDNALVAGVALDRRPVGRDIILEVCADFDLHAAAATVHPEAARARNEPIASSLEGGGEEGAMKSLAAEAPAPAATVQRRRRFSFF
jgi:general secretion pathway protein A